MLVLRCTVTDQHVLSLHLIIIVWVVFHYEILWLLGISIFIKSYCCGFMILLPF